MAREPRSDETTQFHIGAPVIAPDGRVGRIQRVVVDPDTGRIVDLVVATNAHVAAPTVVLPVDRVIDSDENGTRVDMPAAEVRQLPRFEEVRFREPEVGWSGLPPYTPDAVLFWEPRTAVEAFRPPVIVPEPNVEGVRNIPEGTVAISADMDARCGEVVMGHVDRVLYDAEEDRATHLVVRRGILGTDERVVPVSHVRSVTDAAVELDCHNGSLDEFPRYRG
ncbi:MAG: PRC-barrel domain-containing protein [Armatimonadetes bacterium]|nr:PRC-barrel domain-containing protein [Armatimonadota bacterium]